MDSRVVIVTGGAGALGRAVVEHFLAEGDRVAALDISEDVLEGAFPGDQQGLVKLAADLRSREGCQTAVDTVAGALGPVDVLGNIAGGFLMGDPVHETSDETWDFLFELNARSILNMAAATVPGMQARGAGKIVNVAARAAQGGAALMGAYTASKAAVLRLTESMAQELRESGINVNAVMPSLIDTPRNRQDMPDADFSRWVAPGDIAAVVGFLCSDAARAVHGAGIPVDGLS